ncbi:hypothetical protein, conserved [Eimeria praecox]|uniref:Uncharacterized protein n=1 Tax=Eimeria praecox TaxID=51316 RepID=U6H747_9EIME|nr:hypothetical protein, conserved [Eimeria praecox]
MISTTFTALSFIFNTAMRMHMRQAIRRSLEEGSEARDMELFGLKWGELSAEEALGGADIKHRMLDEELPSQKKRQSTKSGKKEEKESNAAFSDTDVGETTDEEKSRQPAQSTTSPREGRAKEKLAEVASAEENPFLLSDYEEITKDEEEGKTGISEEMMEDVRRIMLSRIAQDRAKLNFINAKEQFKKARTEKIKRTKKAWNVAKTSVRLIAESLNYGLNKVLARFGGAWHWAVDVGLKKIIRRFRMLKLFGVIAAWFERVATFVRWFAGEGKFYIAVFDTFRGSASFLVQNADKISALVKGTIQFSVSTLDSTLFFALLLNAITKPVYGLYFAYQGMLEDKSRTEAMQEFRYNRKALTNFLMGSAAMESQVGQVKAFEAPGPELQEIMFLMAYLEQYKAHSLGAQQLRGLNPLQAYTLYERIGRLDFLLQKMNPVERAKFQNVFVALKEWDAEAAATAARDSLLNHVQHCVLLGLFPFLMAWKH